jgi:serine/alanine adding enzyme
MDILINEDIPVSLWDDLLKKNLHASPFQSRQYYDFFNSVKGFNATAIAVADGEELKALAVVTIQKGKGLAAFFTKRGIIYGGPLAEDACPEALDMLLKKVTEQTGDKVIYTETRNLSDFNSLRDVFLNNGYTYNPWLNYRVDTRDMDLMKQRISSSRLRQIKKARQQSVTCQEARNPEEILVFYRMLKELYKRRLHKPLPSEEFFVKFYELKLGIYLFVWHEGKIIGGIMCPLLEGRAVYEFYVCGLDDVHSGLYPSVLATWSAMEYSCKNNIPLFDFMGAGQPGEQYGVRDFKARFGGEMVEYGRFIKISKPFLYKIGKSGLKLMKQMG